MKTFNYTIKDENGIHARPAGIFVKEAAKFKSDITLSKGEKSVDAKRLFGIMGLGVKKGEMITITVNGEDEDNAAMVLEKFLVENL